jgi:hypothetical protein
MVARFASQPGRYTPVESPQVSVAGDGTLAAVYEASRVTIVELPGAQAFAEVGVDPGAHGSDVAWVGSPPRLLVLSRYATSSTVHLLDPDGLRAIAEIELEMPVRLVATVGPSALIIGAHAAMLTATESHLTLYPIPSRGVPLAAGAAAGQFVVALAGTIEEWDPQSRTPRRRLRLPRVASITAVGGSERLVWMTTQQEPARIDVIPLVNRGQPRAHDLPEPIARIAGHPRSDLVACIGATTGRLYVVDLDGRVRLRVIGTEALASVASAGLVMGRTMGVLAAQAQHPLVVVPLDGRELDLGGGRAAGPEPPGDLAPVAPASPERLVPPSPPEPALPGSPWEPTSQTSIAVGNDAPGSGSRSASASQAASLVAPEPAPARASQVPPPAPSAPPARPAAMRGLPAGPATSAARPSPAKPAAFPRPPDTRADAPVREGPSTWRDQIRHNQPPAAQVAHAPPPSAPAPHGEAASSWRDDVVTWYRAAISGALDPAVPVSAALLDTVIARFELAPRLQPILALLYGAHLCGQPGVAPVEVARLLDRRWDEALGRGELAARGAAAYTGSRVALSPAVHRVLDELPPVTGVLVGEPGTVVLLGPCVVIGDAPLTQLAERHRSRVGGAILVARDGIDPAALVLEARAYGAVAMLRVAASVEALPTEPMICVVRDADHADSLGVPRLE